MPPKGKKEEVQAPVVALQRPCTANDLLIASTVKQIQSLVNTEVKWRNRVNSAKHVGQVSQLKIIKLNRLIEQCNEGCGSLQSQLNDFFAALLEVPHSNFSVNVSSAGVVTRAVAVASPGVAPLVPPPAPAAQGKSVKPSAVTEDVVPDIAVQRRKEQLQTLCSLIQTYYDLPRMAKERPPQRPTNAVEMQRELELAGKLAQPNAPPPAAPVATEKPTGKGPPVGAMRPPKAPKASDASSGVYDPFLGELPPSDFFVLPIPKGVDPAVMQFVFLLRSKRLRLEHCASLFASELDPLNKRISCSSTMTVVGSYSVDAVAPQVKEAINLELQLQKTRQLEDQAFLSKRAASAPPPPAAGKK